jgi:hypothetical protein
MSREKATDKPMHYHEGQIKTKENKTTAMLQFFLTGYLSDPSLKSEQSMTNKTNKF